jgi:ectoine hydroxylase-related dioxygenase (phytanoyl-CoA dioxygenase family)
MGNLTSEHDDSHSAAESSSIEDYFDAGAARAHSLSNRGPVRFDAQGRLDSAIVEAYETTGFYVFENVLEEQELSELDADLANLLDRAPAREGSLVDVQGRPALGDGGHPLFLWARPLSDPWGGTTLLNGRHPVRMEEPLADTNVPEKTIFLMIGLFEEMDSALRLSAHPKMLRVAESLNGSDFVPYNDTIFLKEPGVGASVAWHQDGTTHWESSEWHPNIHGFNFMAQLCRTTPANGLWVVPGSHKQGHIDIPTRVAANGGSTRLPDAVPMLCERGDVAICNRQCLHASFANASPDRRATFVWGFFRRDAVLDVEVDVPATRDGEAPRRRRYSTDTIRERCQLVQLAIDARRQHRSEEQPFRYTPLADEEDRQWSPESRKAALRRYAAGSIFI